jgi:hypothetical protein
MRSNGKIMGIEYFDLLHHISTRILNPLATETRTSIFPTSIFPIFAASEAGTWTRVTPNTASSK